MQNFSSIADNLSTSKDSLLAEAAFDTGLNASFVKKLYESYQLKAGGDTAAQSSFLNFIAPKPCFYDPNQFFEQLKSNNVVLEESPKTTNEILFYFNNIAQDASVAAPILFKVVANILKSKNSKFEKVEDQFVSAEEKSSYAVATQLFESANFTSKEEACQNTIALYEGLRDILSRNNSKWGYSYHLENAHAAIIEYLNDEIKLLATQNDIVSVNDTFHDELIHQLITSTVNPMYRDVNNLKTLIPDMQTFVFDLMLLTHAYIEEHKSEMAYASQDTFNEYLKSVTELYKAISSSRSLSRVSYVKSEAKAQMEKEAPDNIYKPNHSFILDDLRLDYEKLNLCEYQLQFKNVIDMLYIIKSCSFEFNIKIRPAIRNYLTKAFNLMGQAEKVILERSKINKYKNW